MKRVSCMYRFFIVLFILSVCVCVGSCDRMDGRSEEDVTGVYLSDIQQSFAKQDYVRALNLSYRLKDAGNNAEDEKAVLYGYVYIAQCYMCTNVLDSMRFYFDMALPMAEKARDDWALATIYSALGGNAAFGEGDYSRGIACLIDALQYAEKIRDTSRLVLIKSNLAMVYCLIRDSTGLVYARDVFNIGWEKDDDYVLFLGAMTSANLHWMMRDTVNALMYIKNALPYVETYDASRDVYVLYADILRAMGDRDNAELFYWKAFAEQSGPGIFSKADLYLGYSELLREDGRYGNAVEVLEDGLRMMDSLRAPAKRPMMYRNLSGIYEDMGDFKAALQYYKQYNEDNDKQLNFETEREINNIRRDYDKQRHELELLEWRNKYNLALVAFVFAICVFVGLYVLYRNKVRNYRQLLKQHQAILEQQETRSVSQSPVPMPEDRMREMYGRVEKLMRERELYRQSDLSRDKVAQMLSTNRTYLCSVIKSFTGMTFPYYVNSFRINEAVRRLSDSCDDTPIKAIAVDCGFSNLTTFYRLFEAAKGMPPSQYRETVIQNAKLANCKN